jgi:hypothetical protein
VAQITRRGCPPIAGSEAVIGWAWRIEATSGAVSGRSTLISGLFRRQDSCK